MNVSAAARAMYDRDPSAEALGIELVEASADRAVVRMTVRSEMCNGLDIAHGGMTFLLADSAMAFASNSGEGDAVATSAEIDWLAPARVGDVLTATAERRWSTGRSTVWDISVAADDRGDIAIVRGRTRVVTRP